MLHGFTFHTSMLSHCQPFISTALTLSRLITWYRIFPFLFFKVFFVLVTGNENEYYELSFLHACTWKSPKEFIFSLLFLTLKCVMFCHKDSFISLSLFYVALTQHIYKKFQLLFRFTKNSICVCKCERERETGKDLMPEKVVRGKECGI